MKTDEQIRESAKGYVKTLPALNYRSAYNFGEQNIAAFEAGANWYKQALSDMQKDEEKDNLVSIRKDIINLFFNNDYACSFRNFGEKADAIIEIVKPYLHQPAPDSDAVEFAEWIFNSLNDGAIHKWDEAETWTYFKTAHGTEMTSEELYKHWKLNHKQQ